MILFFLLDIYPAREKPIEGVTSDWLLNKIENPNKKLVQKNKFNKGNKKSKYRGAGYNGCWRYWTRSFENTKGIRICGLIGIILRLLRC